MEMKKYMTRGVQECIPFDLVVLMWQMYDRCKEDMDLCDYLHVFQLKMLEGDMLNQEIIHQQEVPEYERTYVIAVNQPVTEKVYIIQSDEYITMLLANEY
ncbi:Staphylococcal protein of uncharacterised function (DUF960) [Turicibacter sanguinis]|nr:Staphylococcal protein of uncharacterised function (DUF960) [Turicibacter sanguinis]